MRHVVAIAVLFFFAAWSWEFTVGSLDDLFQRWRARRVSRKFTTFRRG